MTRKTFRFELSSPKMTLLFTVILRSCGAFVFWLAQTEGQESVNKSLHKFPKDFSFGVSTASYQIEGGWNEDGKGISVWDYVSHVNPIVDYRQNGDVAADSYHLYKRDVELMREMGVTSYKFSISWPRILPDGLSNKVNYKGIAYYNNLIDELLANNIEPFVTMYHWDLPQKLQEKDGILSDEFPTWFGEYARVLFTHFGDRVKYWITINEPYIHCLFVFELMLHPPQIYLPGRGFYDCSRNILLAHAKAYHIYDKEFRATQNGKISLNVNLDWPIASTNSTDDEEAVLDYKAFRFGIHVDPIFSKEGNYPQRVIDRVALMSSKQGLNSSRLKPLTDEEIKYIRGTADYMALNHYSSDMVYRNTSAHYHSPSLWEDANYEIYKDPSWQQSLQLWLRGNPPGFYKVLHYVKDTYNDPDIFIIETGFPTKSGLVDDGRIYYLRGYLSALQKAIRTGVKVKGFFVWSLIDTFEWRLGYTQKFGLYEVDMNDPGRRRTARKSALVYKEIIRSRVIDYNYNPDPLIGRSGASTIARHMLISLTISVSVLILFDHIVIFMKSLEP